jgi:serine protease Do
MNYLVNGLLLWGFALAPGLMAQNPPAAPKANQSAPSKAAASQAGQNQAPSPQAASSETPAAAPDKSSAKPDPSKMAVLQELSNSLENITEQTGKAVVQIFARSFVPTKDAGNSDQLLTSQDSSGSGVLLTSTGYILTNSHVVAGARSLRVQLSDPRTRPLGDIDAKRVTRALPATVVGIDRITDLAVIKIEGNNYPYLSLGNSTRLKQGQIVMALGNPLGLENSVSMGVVSAVSRQLKPDDLMTYIQTDAPINPGNSGGPLVDTEGRVIGINTFIITQSGGSEGIGFAIPSSVAKVVYEQLRQFGHVHRAELGIVGQAVTPAMADGLGLQMEQGVIVSDVDKGGPADQAGLQADDIILSLNGRRVTTPRQLEYTVFRQGPGSTIILTIQRGEQKLDLFAKPAEHSDPLDSLADLADPTKNLITQLGIIGIDITPQVASLVTDLRRPAGVLVAASTAARPYSPEGLKTGDVIFSVNRKIISSVTELKGLMDSLKSGNAAVLLVQREDNLVYVPLEVE